MPFDLERFKRTFVFDEDDAPVSSLLASAEALRGMDRYAEQEKARWGKYAAVAIVAAIALAVIGGAGEMPLLLALAAPLAPLGVVSGVVAWRRGRCDVEDARYQLLEHAVRLLSTDMDEGARLSAHLDLRPWSHKSKFERAGRVRDWKVRYFVDPWLRLGGRLIDGTRFDLTVTDKGQRRSKWKRSRSGKMKHKSKDKRSVEAQLRLKVKERRYGGLTELAPEAQSAVQLPRGARLKALAIEEGHLVIRAAAPYPCTQELVALLFLSLYQVLNLARTLTKHRRAG